MMIGPAPMIRMLSMSVRFGITSLAEFAGCSSPRPRLLASQCVLGELQLRLQTAQHEVIEALEERPHVVRSRARLGMALETEGRAVGESETLERAVEERAMRRLHGRGQRRFIDRETVILAGDEHASRLE